MARESKKALVIGVSDYKKSNLGNLDFCENDGEQMYLALKDLDYEIPKKRKLVGNVSSSLAKNGIIDFFRDSNVKSDDMLLVYFSGHGVLDGFDGRYFATSDVNTDIPEKNGIPFEFLIQQMDRSISRRTIAILDCCFSGSALPKAISKGPDAENEAEKLGREALSKQFEKSEGKCVLASSQSDKRSFDLPTKKMSAFTFFVIEGLKGNQESVDAQGYVTPEKLDEYVYSELTGLPGQSQRPVRNLSISGKISLAYHPHLIDESLKHPQKELKKIKQRKIELDKEIAKQKRELKKRKEKIKKQKDKKLEKPNEANSFVFSNVEINLDVVNSKSMMTHHTVIWEIFNTSKEELTQIFYSIAGDIPKKFPELNVKATDENGDTLEISSIVLNNPTAKRFYIKPKKPIKPRQKNRIIKMEYDWEEPDRYYEYELPSKCKKFKYGFTIHRDFEIKNRILYTEPRLGYMWDVSPSPGVKYLSKKTQITWETGNIDEHQGFRFQW